MNWVDNYMKYKIIDHKTYTSTKAKTYSDLRMKYIKKIGVLNIWREWHIENNKNWFYTELRRFKK